MYDVLPAQCSKVCLVRYFLQPLEQFLWDGNLGLEDLARTANELNRWEFMFVASPTGVPHGAGAAINPTAVF